MTNLTLMPVVGIDNNAGKKREGITDQSKTPKIT